MTKTVAQFRDELADREAIRDCLYRYSRGVDRCDEDMLRSVYWEDAFDDHVLFRVREKSSLRG
jgi:SnoaL-like domain